MRVGERESPEDGDGYDAEIPGRLCNPETGLAVMCFSDPGAGRLHEGAASCGRAASLCN